MNRLLLKIILFLLINSALLFSQVSEVGGNNGRKEYLFGAGIGGDLYEQKKILLQFGIGYSFDSILFGLSTLDSVRTETIVPPLYFGVEARIIRYFSLANTISYSVSTIIVPLILLDVRSEISRIQNSTRLMFHLPFWTMEWYLGVGFEISFFNFSNFSSNESFSSLVFSTLNESLDDSSENSFFLNQGIGMYNFSVLTGFRINLLDFLGLYLEVGFPVNIFSGGIFFRV